MTTKVYYKITFPNGTCYIGRTKNFKYRLGDHIRECKRNEHKNPKMQSIFDEYGCDEWVYEWLFVGVGNKKYHSQREYSIIQTTPNTINTLIGDYALFDSWGEYYNQNEKRKAYDKAYKIKHKERLSKASAKRYKTKKLLGSPK